MKVDVLKTHGYVVVDRPLRLQELVENALHSWQAFCVLSPDEKRKFSGGNRVKDFGYIFHEDSGAYADAKELFHVKRTLILLVHGGHGQ